MQCRAQIFRFYIKCTQCSSEITFKTDPKSAFLAVQTRSGLNGWLTYILSQEFGLHLRARCTAEL